MERSAGRERRVEFRSPGRFLADLDPVTTGRVIASAADVALIVDAGVIKDVALGSDELCSEGYDRAWRDKRWVETVTVESRAKIEDLLRTAPTAEPRWRQVNHPSSRGVDLPINYTAVKTGQGDRIVAFGRDLRSISRLQQRLVEAHQSLERDYARLREAEARYKLLFQSVSQPVLIAAPDSLHIEEANSAAAAMLGRSPEALAGTSLASLFATRSRRDAERALAAAASDGQSEATGLRLKAGGTCDLAASAFREADATRVIVRLHGEAAAIGARLDEGRSALLEVLESLPDGLVVAGRDLRILAANRAFVEMTSLVSPGQMVGGRLADFLGRSPTELNVLISSLKTHGVVRNFATVLRNRFGDEEDAEVSAVAASHEESALFGFSVRNVARRPRAVPRMREGLPSSAEQLTGLVGRAPLREIVRESTAFIEKLCIEAALEITHDNRASAAEMLGLSRQAFYSKMKRFGADASR